MIEKLSTNKLDKCADKKAEKEKEKGTGFGKILEKETEKDKDKLDKNIAESKKEHDERIKQEDKNKVAGKTEQMVINSSPALRYLFNLNKDVNKMSVSERFELDPSGRLELPPDVRAGLKSMSQLLKERGLSLDKLSNEQILKLHNSKDTPKELDNFLSTLLKEAKVKEKDETLTTTQEPKKEETSKDKKVTALEDENEKGKMLGKDVTPDVKLDGQTPVPLKEGEFQKFTVDQKREAMIRQIMDHIELRRIGDNTELNIKFNPAHFGDLNLKLNYQKGKMEANFFTSSSDVKDLIEGSFTDLKKDLNRKGIELTDAKVTLTDKV